MILFFTLIITTNKLKFYVDNVSSLTRPMWDQPAKQFKIINHYYQPNLEWKNLCELHGWQYNNDTKPKVYDATLFSVELDLLELRLVELYDVVDKFLILESNSTFTGLPKELVFAKNRARFAFAEDKILYKAVEIPMIKKGQDPFELEAMHRSAMNLFMAQVGIENGDLVLMSDVDEIPSWHSIELLRSCSNVPFPMHLQLQNYIYSFEFLVDMDSWRAKVVKFPYKYGHIRSSDNLLANSGWHCSYCFKTISDFRFKMKGFSHADRVHSKLLLDTEHIQKVICEGSNIYGLLPEAFSYQELAQKWGPVPARHSVIGMPKGLLRNPERYKFLLPGNCKRDEV